MSRRKPMTLSRPGSIRRSAASWPEVTHAFDGGRERQRRMSMRTLGYPRDCGSSDAGAGVTPCRRMPQRALRRRFRRLAAEAQAGGRGAGHFAAHDPVGARRRHLRSQRSSPATMPRASSARASSSSPAAWCRRGSRARGKLLAQYGPIFSRIEQQFGVPGPVIVAIWGLETDFGANSGNFPPSARWRRWPTIAAGRTNSAAN